MPDTPPVSRHVSVTVDSAPEAVYAVAADPARLSEWAAGLSSTPLHPDGDSWFADAPFGRVRVRFTPANPYGVLDHVVTMPDGTEVLNPMRVLPFGASGSEVVFTVRRRAGMTDEQFEGDAQAVATDLDTLRDLVERG
jgi:hypothetical protein